ncbi:hypothetical protein PV721_20920 [Streptomyces sp. MB09-01]|uniref:hypothetical protein n=1 Tax=Streptomyces sp. MB09-01 TaxID=3028666 RepID=UPI0029AE7A6D|nr:hypothetical protein [Streptomyces sp. MB09-01]MDX3536793.1 hypothetical protein [Streptomyces sp. MB09-01]
MPLPLAVARRWTLRRKPAGGGVPDDELAVEDQVLGQLLGNGDQDGEPVLDEGAAPGLQGQSAAVACGGEEDRAGAVQRAVVEAAAAAA